MLLDHLDFSNRTAKRVAWEAWEFTVEGPYLVRVTNAAYGYLKDDHSYVVGIEDRGGILVPAECECPADVHHDKDCKHKLALATVGGPVVIQAAADYEPPAELDAERPITAADKLRADGGTQSVDAGDPGPSAEEERPECDCAVLSGAFPCWPCYRDGLK